MGLVKASVPGRTLDHTAPAPEATFRHARHVLVPETINSDRRSLLTLYGEYIRLSYRLLDRP